MSRLLNLPKKTPNYYLFHYSVTASEHAFLYSPLYFLVVKAIQKVTFHMLTLSFSLRAHKTERKQAASTRIFSFAQVFHAATKTNVSAPVLELFIIIFCSWPNLTSVI